MRIAVASEGLAVSPYFGHCASFTCYRIERGIIVECQNMPNPHQTPARIAAVLRELDVTAVITGIIERDAVEALQAAAYRSSVQPSRKRPRCSRGVSRPHPHRHGRMA